MTNVDVQDLNALAVEAESRFGAGSLDDAFAAIAWAQEVFGPKVALASSMGDEALVHLAGRAAPGIDVLFIDTGYHFDETLLTRDAVSAAYDVNVTTMLPLLSIAEQEQEHGADLFARHPDQCCAMRKVEPLERGLTHYQAWITGMRREDAPTRTDIPVVGWDAKRSMLKLNPLAACSQDDVDAYVALHDVLVNPLRDKGYPSIGCAPCTRAVNPGDDPRSGRWAGSTKTECGLHT